MSKVKVCLRHISELFLYEYYCLGDDEYEISGDDTLTEHKLRAKELLAAADYAKSQQEWISANLDNPVDMESILGIILCCKQLGDVEGEYFYTNESYNYSCTRAEMAAFYRNIGWYYLEKYDPDTASACYMYSQLFDKTSQAEDEIKFLEKALNKKFPEKTPEELQKVLKSKGVPTEANPVTLALLFKAGNEAESAGQIGQALDCYRMLYDLSQDVEISEKISTLQTLLNY